MNSTFRKALVLALTGAMTCGMLAGCGDKKKTVDPAAAAITVNGDTLSLGAVSIFAKIEQAQIYSYYTSYFGQMDELFDMIFDEETGETYGDSMKSDIQTNLEKLMVMKQHAEEFGVSLTDEEKAEIETAAQAFIDANGDTVSEISGASAADVAALLELQTIQSKMMDPMVTDVDTEISLEEAQQTSVSYIRVAIQDPAEDTESGAESLVSAVDVESVAEVADVESAAVAVENVESAAEAVESGVEAVAEPMTKEAQEAYDKAVKVIEIVSAAKEGEDIGDLAKAVDDDLYDVSSYFTTNDAADTYMDAAIPPAVAGLADGEVLDHPVLSEDGGTYFVVRMEKNYDEDRTETKKASILSDRKQELYDSKVDEWLEAAEITVDEAAWASIVISDKAPMSMTTRTEETAVESTVESVVESAASVVDVESVVEVSAVESAVEEAK